MKHFGTASRRPEEAEGRFKYQQNVQQCLKLYFLLDDLNTTCDDEDEFNQCPIA